MKRRNALLGAVLAAGILLAQGGCVMKKDHDKVQAELTQVKSELEACKMELSAAKGELQTKDAALRQAEGELTAAKKTGDVDRARALELQRQLDEAAPKLTAANEQVKTLTAERDQAAAKAKADAAAEIDRLRQQVRNLEEMVAKLKETPATVPADQPRQPAP